MWVLTKIGFFSATLTNPSYQDLPLRQQVGHIMVRARVRQDLVRLIDLYRTLRLVQDDAPEVLSLVGHDYPYRIIVTKANWARLTAALAEDIDYSNFKSAVESSQSTPALGKARHDLYMKIWGVLYGAEAWLRDRVAAIEKDRKEQSVLFFPDSEETTIRGGRRDSSDDRKRYEWNQLQTIKGVEKLSARPPKKRGN